MKIRYCANGCDGYIAVTNESPKDFRGVLFIGKGPQRGGDPTSVIEQVFSINQVQGLKEVALADVPDEWVLAFGYEKPLPKPITDTEPWTPPASDTEPLPCETKVVRRRRPQTVTVIDVEFPWETATRKYDKQGNQVAHWWEIVAIAIGAVIALVILWPYK